MSSTSSSKDQAEAEPDSERSSNSTSASSQQDAGPSDVFEKALNYLSMQTGDAEVAKRALEATAAPELTDAVRWAEEAAVWLATLDEVDIEQKAMGAAMELSLVEAEAEKEKEKPVYEQSEEQLKLRYNRSTVLHELACGAAAVLPTLWEHHRNSLLDLLELELKARKWYPRAGTTLYLQNLGRTSASLLCCAAAHDSRPVRHKSVKRHSSSKLEPPVRPDIDAVLSTQLQSLQGVLYAMPETSGAVPLAFADIEEAQEQEGIDEVLERPKKRLCQSECVDLL